MRTTKLFSKNKTIEATRATSTGQLTSPACFVVASGSFKQRLARRKFAIAVRGLTYLLAYLFIGFEIGVIISLLIIKYL